MAVRRSDWLASKIIEEIIGVVEMMGPQGVGRGLGWVWEGSRVMDQRMALEPE